MNNYTLDVYHYFGKKHFSDPIDKYDLPENIYRCHLVEDYLSLHGIEGDQQLEIKKRTNATYGVRHSIQILAHFLNNKTWLIPFDVYPVYGQILNDEHCQIQHYETITKNPIFDFLEQDRSDVLLICDPLKPKNHSLQSEITAIKNWLNVDPNRILVVDAVYNTEMDFKRSLYLSLQNDGFNIIFLHSLAKTFCLPKTFGIMVLPHLSNELYQEFRLYCQKKEKDLNALKIAYIALNIKSDLPNLIKHQIVESYFQFKNEHPAIELPELNKNNPSYLFIIPRSFAELSQTIECFSPYLYIYGKDWKNTPKDELLHYADYTAISTLKI